MSRKTDALEDRLVCQDCGGDAMRVVVGDDSLLTMVCTNCGRVVGYGSDLIRVLAKRQGST